MIASVIGYKKGKGHKGFPYGLLKTEETHRTDETEIDFSTTNGITARALESTWPQEFQNPFEFSVEIISEREYELSTIRST